MRKRFVIALICSMLLVCLAACDMEFGGLVGELLETSDLTGPGQDVQEQLSGEESDSRFDGTDAEADSDAPSDLPADLYAGQTLTILGENADDLGENSESSYAQLASYNRNVLVEQKYGIRIECMSAYMTEIKEIVTNDVGAGVGEIDVIMAGIATSGSLLTQNGFLTNLNDLPYVDLSCAKWDAGFNRDMAFGEYLPMAAGEILPGSDLKTSLIVFNSDLAAQKNPDLYGYVQTGGWTLDKLYAIVTDSYEDLNGNGKADAGDIRGLVADYTGADAFAVGAEVAMVKKDEDNLPSVSKKATDGITHAYDVLRKMITHKSTLYYSMTDMPMYPDPEQVAFEIGNTLLCGTDLQAALNLSQLDMQIGILPYPKLDEAQEAYHSYVNVAATAVMVSKGVPDLDFVGYALQALSEASFFRTLLPERVCHNPQDAEMLELILGSKTPDFGGSYVTSGLSFYIRKALEIDTKDVSKVLKESATKVERDIRHLVVSLP